MGNYQKKKEAARIHHREYAFRLRLKQANFVECLILLARYKGWIK